MQQINSGYRGDSSETLSQIMQGQYAPLAMLNQFTNALTQTGINNASATQRAAMQIDAQRELEENRLRAASSQFDKTYSLQEITEGAKARYYDNAGNKDAIASRKAGSSARGKLMSRMADLQMVLSRLPKNDPKRPIIEEQIRTLMTAGNLGDDEVVGFAGASGQMADRPDLAALILQALGKPAGPAVVKPGPWTPTQANPETDVITPDADYYPTQTPAGSPNAAEPGVSASPGAEPEKKEEGPTDPTLSY
jgi:hypothetical protein